MTETSFAQEICRHLEWNVKLRMKADASENLHAHYRRGELTITSSGIWVENFAVQTYALALRANCLGDFLGSSKPRFKMRALWIDSIQDEDPESVIQWIVGCGFNTLINSDFPDSLLTSYGVKRISIHSLGALEPANDETYCDACAREIKQIGNPLIFYVDEAANQRRESEWLDVLIDEMDAHAWLGVGENHPYWDTQRARPDASTGQLAIVRTNIGLLNPIPKKIGTQSIEGAVISINEWPKDNSKEAKDLWVAGQSLWWEFIPK